MKTQKKIVYYSYLAHQAYADVIATRGDVSLDGVDHTTAQAQADQLFADAHVFQIPATRGDVPAYYRADAALLARCPQLLVVSSSGAGYDTVDVDDCTRAGIIVVNQAGGNREAVAEHALAMMLTLSKKVIQSDRAMRRAVIHDRTAFMGNDLKDKTVGIVGLGAIGTRLADMCRAAFQMRVLAHDPFLAPEAFAAHGATSVALETLIAESDFVSLNCPLTAETRHLFGARAFALMKPSAYFITTARGGIHDEAALAEALTAGTIAGAGLDVWETEPPLPEHPLMAFDNVLVSCHTAGVTHEARRTIATIAAEQVLELLDGRQGSRVLNPEAWDRFSARRAALFM
jgi:D-3-phosphoglycerate dehydrogenase